MLAGIVVCVAVLAAATAFGLARRIRDGKLRQVRPRQAGEREMPGPAAAGLARITQAQLGEPLGSQATLLQFSSAFCAPCRATRQVLHQVAEGTGGVSHVEVDVADRLDLVRLLDVRRTPTVFLLDPDGRVARRGSGLMHKADVLAALGDLR